MESVFASLKAKRRVLPSAIRRTIVDLKAEHPPLNLEEIANICGVLFGCRPDGHTVKVVLKESAIPRKARRRFERYHDAEDIRESRLALVTLHREGWADKSIADYMGVDRSTVYRVRKRFEEHGEEASNSMSTPPGPRTDSNHLGGAVFLPGSSVAHIARVRSPRLNRGTLCRTERHNC